MNLPQSLAQQITALYFGDNWSGTNFQKAVQDLSWQHASTSIHGLNTIAALLFHTNYYIVAQIEVFLDRPLIAHDALSFDLKPIESEEEWIALQSQSWHVVEEYIDLVKNMTEQKLWSVFSEEKYGTIHKAILGIIEHSNYHLGQISLIKKLIISNSNQSI
jgi:uncharacterized damage-inducible protein DinB